MNYPGKAYADLCEKKLIDTKWCYRCPNENCKKSSKTYKMEGFNDDGRYVYTKEGGRFTAIKQHMMKCIKLEKCIELLEGNKKQNKIIGEEWDNSSVTEKVALDFIELIVDENIPLLSCNKSKFRNIVYRGYTGNSIRKLCTKTISKIYTSLQSSCKRRLGRSW